MGNMFSRISIIAIIIFMAAPLLFAKEFDYSIKSSDDCFCFRGKPRPKCGSFLIVETGYLSRLTESDQTNYENMITSDFGLMFNCSRNSSVGGTFSFTTDGDGTDIGIGVRYRRWLSRRLALDFSPRVIFLRAGGWDLDSPGYQISTSVSIGELFSVDIYYRHVRYKGNFQYPADSFGGPPKRESDGFHLGVSGRSYASVAVPTISLLLYLLLRDMYEPPVF